jgi:DNA-binding NtrC family response regulator
MTRMKPRVLVAVGGDECGCLVSSLSALANVELGRSLEETVRKLQSSDFDVLFCAWNIGGGTWADVLRVQENLHIELPTVVYYHCGGEREWTRALAAGAFDLLVPPFEADKLNKLLEHALVFGQRQKQVA